MRLSDLTRYHSITIQCHDNPDADAIASGYALYTYFKQIGKEVRFNNIIDYMEYGEDTD